MDSLNLTKRMFAAVAIAACLAAPAEARKRQTEQDQAEQLQKVQKAMSELKDQLFVAAHESGMGILITTSLNLDHKYSTNDMMVDNSAMYTSSRTGTFITDRTSTSIWKGDANGSLVKVGNQTAATGAEIDGWLYQFVAGGTLYMIYIIAPGTYSITGASFDLPRSLAPKASAARGDGVASKIGQVVFKEKKFSEFEKGQEWRNAKYNTEAVKSSYCALAIAGGNHCVSWATYTDHVTTQTSAAGYQETTSELKVDGLSVEATLASPFASFSVSPGDVVLIDGLFAENPAASFNGAGCERVSSDTVNCALTGFDLARIPAFIVDLDNANAESRGYPKLAQLLKQAQYRELNMTAKLDTQKPGGLDRYFISTGK
ncbi:MAG: hypothetical protein ABIO17_09485 [Pseudoxanthomonas sp.]